MKKVGLWLAFASLFVTSAGAFVINEKFTNDPAADGWQVFGDTNLFQWDSAHQNLAVTWDSSKTNSYFYHPLGAVFSKTNDFCILFDLRLNDLAIGTTPGRPLAFELSIGLINTAEATSGNFFRGYAYFPDLVDFDYFPNDINDYGATVSTLLISSQTNYSSGGFTQPLEMTTNTLYRVTLIYTATNRTLHTLITADGAPFGPVEDSYLDSKFDDFRVDAISINSYSDNGQDPDYSGSILAHGTVDNLAFASALPLGAVQAIAAASVQFGSDTNWLYTLERTTDFQSWTNALPPTPGTGGTLILSDTNAPANNAFYRVRADLP